MNIDERIVITGVGLTAPNGNTLGEFRNNLLNGVSGVQKFTTRYLGDTLAGICNFDPLKYQKKKDLRRGTRAGSISIYCANEAIADSKLDFETFDKSRIGVYVGITEHGNVETENEVYNLSQFEYDTKTWTHHHNPRTVANNPAGEVTLNMKITGPHYTIGAARIFAAFRNEGALANHADPTKASRPFDAGRNGIVISEGGCVYTLERLSDALKRGAKIYAEIVSHATNSDALDFVLPNSDRQAECISLALKNGGLKPEQIDLVNTHATSTPLGDVSECNAVKKVFGTCDKTYINNTKGFIGHTMGAAGALELAGNLDSFNDCVIHPAINIDKLDPACDVKNLVINTPKKVDKVEYILNNSFGMLGINSVLIVKKYKS